MNAPVKSPKLVLQCAWPALLISTFCLLPFLNKGWVVDDSFFLGMARQIVQHPRHPMDFDTCWNWGAFCAKAWLTAPGNTLLGYVLVPTVLLGEREWVAHATQLIWVWGAVIAMASLALRFGYDRWHATAATLMLVVTTPFLPMASTAMPDIMAGAIALIAIERLAAWKAERRTGQAIAAGIALGLSGTARANLALMLPLGAFFLFDTVDPRQMLRQFRKDYLRWIPVLIGAGVLASVIYLTRERSALLDPPSLVTGLSKVRTNLKAYFLYFCYPLPFALYWIVARWYRSRVRVLIAFALSLVGAVVLHDKRYFFAIFGAFALLDVFWKQLRKLEHGSAFLVLWILVPVPIAYYMHLPIKYLLPCLPAIVFLTVRLTEQMPPAVARASIAAGIALSAALSVCILRSDAEFANFGRDSVFQLVKQHVDRGERVWYPNEFHTYWYGHKAGGTLMYANTYGPRPGDLLFVGMIEGGHTTLNNFNHRTLVAGISHKYSFGRTFGDGIGLYSNGFGIWVWGFGESEDDRYELWRIE